MSETCRDCGKEFTETDSEERAGCGEFAIGITGGIVIPGDGFYMGDNDPWEVYCLDCHTKREGILQNHSELVSLLKESLERVRINNCEGEELKFIKELEQAINKAEGRG